MQTFSVIMRRTYETEFTIEANSTAEAQAIFDSLGDFKYESELEQMNVTDTDIYIFEK